MSRTQGGSGSGSVVGEISKAWGGAGSQPPETGAPGDAL